MDEEYIATKDYSKNENRVVDFIMDSRGELSKVTKDMDDYIQHNQGLTTKSVLATAIEENYGDQIKLSTDIKKVSDWIVEFSDYLMGLFVDEFINNPYTFKLTSNINHMNMFYAYIALSAQVQGKKNWKTIVNEQMNSIDFSRQNPLWRNIGLIYQTKANKKLRNKLYKLFEGGAK
jgi:hypothetical protein